ncbi:MAG: ribbon-helix-helix domain-containing protein [Thermoanaerobaculia bacterium]
MAKVRITVSLEESVVERTDRLALALRLSRGQFFSQALDEFLRRYENQALLDAINSACDAMSEQEDVVQRQAMRAKQRHLVR